MVLTACHIFFSQWKMPPTWRGCRFVFGTAWDLINSEFLSSFMWQWKNDSSSVTKNWTARLRHFQLIGRGKTSSRNFNCFDVNLLTVHIKFQVFSVFFSFLWNSSSKISFKSIFNCLFGKFKPLYTGNVAASFQTCVHHNRNKIKIRLKVASIPPVSLQKSFGWIFSLCFR